MDTTLLVCCWLMSPHWPWAEIHSAILTLCSYPSWSAYFLPSSPFLLPKGPSSSYLKLLASYPHHDMLTQMHMEFSLSRTLLYIIQDRIELIPPGEPVCRASSNKWSAPLFYFSDFLYCFPVCGSHCSPHMPLCSSLRFGTGFCPPWRPLSLHSYMFHPSLPLNLCSNKWHLLKDAIFNHCKENCRL